MRQPFARVAGFVLAGLAVWIGAAQAETYRGGEVTNGGALFGRVTLTGKLPEYRAFPMVIYPNGEFCKKISDGRGHVLLKEFNVFESGLQDAVVSLQDVQTGKHFRFQENKLVTVNCMFHPADVPEDEQFDAHAGNLTHVHPLVSVMRNHEPLGVVNRDPVMHAIQIYQKETGLRLMTFPLPVTHKPQLGYVQLANGKRIVQVICAMHEYMQTWGWIVDNPYYARSRRGGGYLIDEIPPGTYKVMAWHPHMQPIEKIVTVPPNGVVELDFEFDGNQVTRPHYETQTRFRMGPESDPTVDLEGCEGPFCVERPAHVHPE
jgi:hypothetical protein